MRAYTCLQRRRGGTQRLNIFAVEVKVVTYYVHMTFSCKSLDDDCEDVEEVESVVQPDQPKHAAAARVARNLHLY